MHCVHSGEAAGEPDVRCSNTAVHPLIADAIEEAGFIVVQLPVPSSVDGDGGARYRIAHSDIEVSTYVDEEDGAFVGIDHDDEPAFTSQTLSSADARDLASALLAAADAADSLRRREQTTSVRRHNEK